ncbi:hypothetical protein [Paracoccus marcusii]|uniref:hypothetical protein n=1 Tax=Paracoccus marcusii TaxID=59779 RepID=UPI003736A732
MEQAITLARFYLKEASRLAGAANLSGEIGRAEALRKWLREKWTKRHVTVRDVLQRGPGSLRESPKAKAALRILEEHGWLTPLEPGTIVDGRACKEAWQIVEGVSDEED